jgi:hypothetical protein
MKKSAKKLVLNRETVGALQAPALKAVHGGTSECVTADCGFSWWSCELSGCGSCSCWTD